MNTRCSEPPTSRRSSHHSRSRPSLQACSRTTSPRDTQCVGDELDSCGSRLDVRVDVAGECKVERAVGEWQRWHVGADELDAGQTSQRELQHLRALVDADDAAPQVPGQEAGPAADVEHPPRRQARDEPLDRLTLGLVERLPRGRVVLGRPASVVLLHPRVLTASRFELCRSVFRQTSPALTVAAERRHAGRRFASRTGRTGSLRGEGDQQCPLQPFRPRPVTPC